jgi:hypothetical protein
MVEMLICIRFGHQPRFPVRMLYSDFVREFRAFMATPAGEGGCDLDAMDDEALAVELLLRPEVAAALAAVSPHPPPHGAPDATVRHAASQTFRPGTTKLFFRADAPFALRNLKNRMLHPLALRVQRWWWRQKRGHQKQQRRWRRAKAECDEFRARAEEAGMLQDPAVVA